LLIALYLVVFLSCLSFTILAWAHTIRSAAVTSPRIRRVRDALLVVGCVDLRMDVAFEHLVCMPFFWGGGNAGAQL
jgi:hypothetical protein